MILLRKNVKYIPKDIASVSSLEKLRKEKTYNKENSLRPIPPKVIGSIVNIQTKGSKDKKGSIDAILISIDRAV